MPSFFCIHVNICWFILVNIFFINSANKLFFLSIFVATNFVFIFLNPSNPQDALKHHFTFYVVNLWFNFARKFRASNFGPFLKGHISRNIMDRLICWYLVTNRNTTHIDQTMFLLFLVHLEFGGFFFHLLHPRSKAFH